MLVSTTPALHTALVSLTGSPIIASVSQVSQYTVLNTRVEVVVLSLKPFDLDIFYLMTPHVYKIVYWVSLWQVMKQ